MLKSGFSGRSFLNVTPVRFGERSSNISGEAEASRQPCVRLNTARATKDCARITRKKPNPSATTEGSTRRSTRNFEYSRKDSISFGQIRAKTWPGEIQLVG